MKKNSYYITGGAGFIGRHFNSLVESDNVINIDLRSQSVVPNQILGDIRKIDDIKNSIGDSNTILHLAASHYDFESDYFETNVKGTKNLLKVASEKNINTFVFYSSVAVYGDTLVPANENSPIAPTNDYGRSKYEAEKLIKAWAEEDKDRKVLIIRPTVVFGPHNFGNLFNLTRNINRGVNFHIGDKSVIKSVAYVENLVEATHFLIQNMKSKCEIYNYVDEPQLTNFEISNQISTVLGRGKSFRIPYPIALFLGSIFDVASKFFGKEFMVSVKRVKKFCTPTHFEANKVLEAGFKPRFTTRSGLEKTTNWFVESRDVWEKEYELLKELFKSNYDITIE